MPNNYSFIYEAAVWAFIQSFQTSYIQTIFVNSIPLETQILAYNLVNQIEI